MEPSTIVEHHAEEVLLVLSARAGDAAAVLAADIDRIAECHLGDAVPPFAVPVIVFPQDPIVLVNALPSRPVDGSARPYVRSHGGVGIAAVLRVAQRVHGCGAGRA